MANSINTSWALLVVVLAVVLVVLNFVSYTRCDLILYVNVKPPFGLTKMTAAA